MYQTYGKYQKNGQEFVVAQRKTPRHWYNYFYNDTYNAFASQTAFGEGLVQDSLGRRILLVTSRMLYLADRENGEWFTANGLPMLREYDSYRCRHNLGYTTIESSFKGIDMECTIFVPVQGSCELWRVKVTNRREGPANLRAVAYCATAADGGYRPQGYNTNVAGFDQESQSVMTRLYGAIGTGELRELYGCLLTDGRVTGYDSAKNAFIGVYGSESSPEALEENGGCRNSDCVGEKICLALETDCALAPGESRTLRFAIGVVETPERAGELRGFLEPGRLEKELEKVKDLRLSEIGGVAIETPDPMLNNAFNGFYQYATAMGSYWARVRHNGYRDMMSDSECLGCFNPDLAWQRYKRALSYQYSNGYAPRTFIDGAVLDNNFADCAVWIAFTGYALVKELGDLGLLDEEVPFNDGSAASVYEHIRRSVSFLYDFKGQHGLIKLWGGDWNDCMNMAGLKGKGESVWLSIAWCRANKMLAELAGLLGRAEDVSLAQERGAAIEALIAEYGWDGEYYLTAIDDEGRKIGSHENEEGKMYLNPQLWAVFGQVGSKERRDKAIAAVDAYLDTPLGTVVSKPAYTHIDTAIGSMTMKPAGVHENGGVYLHSMCWKLAVDGILHRPEKVAKDIAQILPWDQTYAPTAGEPYILFNSYFGEQTGYRYATPGQSWRTASTAWFVKAMVLYVFGLQPEMDGLAVKPCLPPDWTDCRIRKVFRQCVYEIHYHQSGKGGKLLSIAAGGKAVDGLLPYRQGAVIQVEVEIG